MELKADFVIKGVKKKGNETIVLMLLGVKSKWLQLIAEMLCL